MPTARSQSYIVIDDDAQDQAAPPVAKVGDTDLPVVAPMLVTSSSSKFPGPSISIPPRGTQRPYSYLSVSVRDHTDQILSLIQDEKDHLATSYQIALRNLEAYSHKTREGLEARVTHLEAENALLRERERLRVCGREYELGVLKKTLKKTGEENYALRFELNLLRQKLVGRLPLDSDPANRAALGTSTSAQGIGLECSTSHSSALPQAHPPTFPGSNGGGNALIKPKSTPTRLQISSTPSFDAEAKLSDSALLCALASKTFASVSQLPELSLPDSPEQLVEAFNSTTYLRSIIERKLKGFPATRLMMKNRTTKADMMPAVVQRQVSSVVESQSRDSDEGARPSPPPPRASSPSPLTTTDSDTFQTSPRKRPAPWTTPDSAPSSSKRAKGHNAFPVQALLDSVRTFLFPLD